MKRSVVTLILVSLMTFGANSQLKITKGSFVGVGLSAFKSGFGGGFLPRINPGVYAKIQVYEEFGIRPEISYSQRGELSGARGVLLEYIDFSLLLDYKYELFESINLSIHTMVGPMWSRMFQASNELYSGLTTVKTDIYGQTSRSDFGILFGGGLAIGTSTGLLFVDTRLFLGKYEITIPTFGEPMLNRTISFVVGFEF